MTLFVWLKGCPQPFLWIEISQQITNSENTSVRVLHCTAVSAIASHEVLLLVCLLCVFTQKWIISTLAELHAHPHTHPEAAPKTPPHTAYSCRSKTCALAAATQMSNDTTEQRTFSRISRVWRHGVETPYHTAQTNELAAVRNGGGAEDARACLHPFKCCEGSRAYRARSGLLLLCAHRCMF